MAGGRIVSGRGALQNRWGTALIFRKARAPSLAISVVLLLARGIKACRHLAVTGDNA
jgi:hypothetical protein